MKQWGCSSEHHLRERASEEDDREDDRGHDECALEAADSAVHVAFATERGPEPGAALLEEDGDDEEDRGDELENSECGHSDVQ